MLDYEYFQKLNNLLIKGDTKTALQLLMQLQARHIALEDNVKTLNARIQEFEDILSLSKALYFYDDFYWLHLLQPDSKKTLHSETNEDKHIRGPYCPHCYEGDETLLRLRNWESTLYCVRCGFAHTGNARAVGDVAERSIFSAKVIPFKK